MERLLTALSPRSPLMRIVYRAPLLLWRMGLTWLLPRSMLVLSTRGRRSGRPRHTMLEHLVHDGHIVIGSAWGARSHWARNLRAHPFVSVETRAAGVVRARARAITDGNTLRVLRERLFRGRQPDDAAFLFWRIEAAGVDAPPPLPRDLRHLPPLFLLALTLLILSRAGVPR